MLWRWTLHGCVSLVTASCSSPLLVPCDYMNSRPLRWLSSHLTGRHVTRGTATCWWWLQEFQQMVVEMDTDGNGQIDFDEFCQIMQRLT
jgi:hypothetical protein